MRQRDDRWSAAAISPVWRRIILSSALGGALTIGVMALPAYAQQQPPKIENPGAIPPAVRPGAIEAQFDQEIVPGIEAAPSVLSPYEPEQPAGADEIRFVLNEVRVEGGAPAFRSQIEAVYAGKIGDEIALSEVFGFARAITRLYADNGYPLSLAYVPVQEIETGVVRIKVIEGFIGDVAVEGGSKAVRARLLKLGEKITRERPLNAATLERYMLLANQLPGVGVSGVLERAASADAGLKLTMKVKQKRFGVKAGANNRASRAVGREKYHAGVNLDDILTGGDRLEFGLVRSFDEGELAYYSGAYSTLVGSEGMSFSLRAGRSEAAPGIPFLRDLGFETQGWTVSTGLSYPLVKTRARQVTLYGGAYWKEFRSAFGVTPNTLDTLWTTEFGVNAQLRDEWDGVNVLALQLTRGWDIFDATEAGSPLASRQGAGAEFITLAADVSRNQKLTDWANFVFALKAQTANNPLLSSEQCGFGGGGFGRGYDPFEIAGDKCIVGIAELSLTPSFLNFDAVKVRPFASFDAGAVRVIGPLAAGEARAMSLSSLGAGARLAIGKHVAGSVEAGFPLKDIPGLPGNRDARFFFTIEASY